MESVVLLGEALRLKKGLLAHRGRKTTYPQADDVDGELLGLRMELRSKLARRPPARLFAVGEYNDDAWLLAEVEHVGCLLHGCCQRCAAGGHQVIYNTQNKVRSVRRWLKLKFDVVALVGTPRTKGNEANTAKPGDVWQDFGQCRSHLFDATDHISARIPPRHGTGCIERDHGVLVTYLVFRFLRASRNFVSHKGSQGDGGEPNVEKAQDHGVHSAKFCCVNRAINEAPSATPWGRLLHRFFGISRHGKEVSSCPQYRNHGQRWRGFEAGSLAKGGRA